jgi:hypothetical protein
VKIHFCDAKTAERVDIGLENAQMKRKEQHAFYAVKIHMTHFHALRRYALSAIRLDI